MAQGSVASAGSTAPMPRKKPTYILEEPKEDRSEPAERTRLTRPGEKPSEPLPVAPDFSRSPAGGLPAPSPVPMPMVEAPPAPARPADRFPSVGRLESLMFGTAAPQTALEARLERLESSVFQKSFPDLDNETRINRLKAVLIGEPVSGPAAASPADIGSAYGARYSAPKAVDEELPRRPFFSNYSRVNLSEELNVDQLEKFGLQVINEVRSEQGLEPLQWDERAAKVAREHVEDLAKRRGLSHNNSQRENPDVRFSKAGGTEAMDESLIMFTSAEGLRKNRDLVAKMLQALSDRQDDRDALLSRHATHFAMAFRWTADRSKLICATEIVTARGQMEPLPLIAQPGDKLEVKGSLNGPYRFLKITVAREDELPPLPDDGEETTEALPYFPPLDYIAYGRKSEKDWDKGMRMLQIAGITAAIAGGFFIPPVALAAPLIAVSAGAPTVKPVSEIPVKGGVKTDGVSFYHKVPLDDNGKPGIYYITVWAQTDTGGEPVPVSRRAVIVRKSGPGFDQGTLETDQEETDRATSKVHKKKKRSKGSASHEQDNDKQAKVKKGR